MINLGERRGRGGRGAARVITEARAVSLLYYTCLLSADWLLMAGPRELMPDDYRDMNNKVAVTDVWCDTHARYLLYSILIERVRCNTTLVSVYTSRGLAIIYGLIEKCSESGSLKYNLQALYTVYIFRHTPKFHCNPCNGFGKNYWKLDKSLLLRVTIANPT